MRTLLLALMFLGCGTSETVEPTPVDDCSLPKENPRFIELATDGYAVMALRSDGRAVCWGEDTEGQCGFDWVGGELEPKLSPAPRCAVSIGIDGNAYAIRDDRSLVVWGREDSSQFGDGVGAGESYGKMFRIPIDEPIVSATFGAAALAVTESGGLYCWGVGCGTDLRGFTHEPKAYPWKTPIRRVTEGQQGCILDANGDVYCRGDNENGELGDGTFENRTDFVKALLPGPAIDLATYFSGACAVLATEQVACWGLDDATLERTPTPKLVEGVSGVTRVRLGSSGGACAFTPGSTATCWASGLARFLPGSPGIRTARQFELYDDVLDIALSESGLDGCVLRASDHWVYCVGDLRAARYDEHEEYEALKEFRPIPEPTE